MLPWHRQGGDKHGDAAQHEHRPHEAAHPPQQDGSASGVQLSSPDRSMLLIYGKRGK